MPSTPPRSTKAPKSRTPVTLPLTHLALGEALARLGGQRLLLLLEQRAARRAPRCVSRTSVTRNLSFSPTNWSGFSTKRTSIWLTGQKARTSPTATSRPPLFTAEHQALDRHAARPAPRRASPCDAEPLVSVRLRMMPLRARLDDVRLDRVAHAEAQDALVVLELAQLDHRLALAAERDERGVRAELEDRARDLLADARHLAAGRRPLFACASNISAKDWSSGTSS